MQLKNQIGLKFKEIKQKWGVEEWMINARCPTDDVKFRLYSAYMEIWGLYSWIGYEFIENACKVNYMNQFLRNCENNTTDFSKNLKDWKRECGFLSPKGSVAGRAEFTVRGHFPPQKRKAGRAEFTVRNYK